MRSFSDHLGTNDFCKLIVLVFEALKAFTDNQKAQANLARASTLAVEKQNKTLQELVDEHRRKVYSDEQPR